MAKRSGEGQSTLPSISIQAKAWAQAVAGNVHKLGVVARGMAYPLRCGDIRWPSYSLILLSPRTSGLCADLSTYSPASGSPAPWPRAASVLSSATRIGWCSGCRGRSLSQMDGNREKDAHTMAFSSSPSSAARGGGELTEGDGQGHEEQHTEDPSVMGDEVLQQHLSRAVSETGKRGVERASVPHQPAQATRALLRHKWQASSMKIVSL